MRFGGRLFIVTIILLIMALPIGLITMSVVCPDGSIDFMDYVAALLVPFYGFLEAMICK